MELPDKQALKEMQKGDYSAVKTVNLYCKTAKNYLSMAIDWMDACEGEGYRKIFQEMEVLKTYLGNVEQKIQELS
jgi:hypothetical protein